MRQRIFKAITCVALIFSVFFSSPAVALAGSDDSALGQMYTGEFDIVSSDVFESTIFGENMSQPPAFQVTLEGGGFVTFSFTKNAGYTYSGVIALGITFSRKDGTSAGNLQNMHMIGIDADMPPGLSYAFQKTSASTVNYSGILYIHFNDFYSTNNDDLLFTINFDLLQRGWINTGVTLADLELSVTQAVDWAGSIMEYPYLGDIDSSSGLLQQQIDQSQQIANQQSQQSQQQHNSLINGYDNEANDSMLADKNSVLQGFEQQQDQAMSNGQQYVADFSANYDTAPLQAMAPAFMMISTWFNDLWGGMGNFSTVLIVGLMLCVAGYILKLKH